MILDSGTCKIYKIANTAGAGEFPNETLVQVGLERCYGELDFSTAPKQYTESLEQIEVSKRIRILQDKSIVNKTVVMIGTEQYQTERMYHGKDDDSGELISDISLSRVVSAYAVI